jgi:hypothetical protein
MSKLTLRIAFPALVLLGGLTITSSSSFAKPDYTKKEKKACAYCHVGPAKKELNEVGKCYAEHNHSLEACDSKK